MSLSSFRPRHVEPRRRGPLDLGQSLFGGGPERDELIAALDAAMSDVSDRCYPINRRNRNPFVRSWRSGRIFQPWSGRGKEFSVIIGS